MTIEKERAARYDGSETEFDYSRRFFPAPDPQQRMFEDESTAAAILAAKKWSEDHEHQYVRLVAEIMAAHRRTGRRQSVRNTSVRLGCSHPHDLDAALGRLMLMEFPEMEGSIRLSKSKVDGYEWADADE